ncbi:type II toxin-antitoxin system YafQ family toxin [Candidatus Synechococcus spongiarum]|uniref:type II toxin-antitoxin system YafQ family toxin n=1 Tax=Candidatus Synechococcus spongiarum TaxID=431041 RepID=UPI0009073F90
MTVPYVIVVTKKYDNDFERCRKRRKDIDKLEFVIRALRWGRRLEPKYKQHKLQGKYKGRWECHIEPDWVLIWVIKQNRLILERTGTHSDLF